MRDFESPLEGTGVPAPARESSTTRIEISRATVADAPAAARLIEAAFARFIAPDLGPVGCVAFRLYVTERALRERLGAGTIAWCARSRNAGTDAGSLIGYAELRGLDGKPGGIDHLSLLFTAVDHQKEGIGRRLLATVKTHLRQAEPPVDTLTVHASRYAVAAYARLGFRAEAVNPALEGASGLPQPMRLDLTTAT